MVSDGLRYLDQLIKDFLVDEFLLQFQQLLVFEHPEIDPVSGVHVLFVEFDLCVELILAAKFWLQWNRLEHILNVQGLAATLLQVFERLVQLSPLTTVKKMLIVLAGGDVGSVAILEQRQLGVHWLAVCSLSLSVEI